MSKKVLFVLGTRPEAVKIAPVYKALREQGGFTPMICHTGQHPTLADEILAFFGIAHDLKLTPKRTSYSLAEFTSECLTGVAAAIEDIKPDLVFVQGDTSTTFCGALAAHYQKISVAHLEAGLRTYNKFAPFPEEMNRKMTTALADFHFAPTPGSRQALLRENVADDATHVVGNSVIDALLWGVDLIHGDAALKSALLRDYAGWGLPPDIAGKSILITGHRRESFGDKFEQICRSIKTLAETHPDLYFIYPVHLNPNVQKPVTTILGNIKNVFLIPPVNYPHFIYLMECARFILTDSGGVQEEAPTLGKPVLVMRETTDRPESIAANCARLVGTTEIVDAANALIADAYLYKTMSQARNPYGDGTAGRQIAAILRDRL